LDDLARLYPDLAEKLVISPKIAQKWVDNAKNAKSNFRNSLRLDKGKSLTMFLFPIVSMHRETRSFLASEV